MEDLKIIDKLSKEDRDKVIYFAKILLKQARYRQLKEEIDSRKKEIENGDILTHDEIWNELNV